jgi:VanZ family protein
LKSLEKSGRPVMKASKQNIMIYRVLLIMAAIIIIYVAATPRKISVVGNINDKVSHIISFYVLALLLDFSFPTSAFRETKVLSLIGYAVTIEIVQHFLSYRTFSLIDLGADAFALVVYRLSLPYLRLVPLFRKRWE